MSGRGHRAFFAAILAAGTAFAFPAGGSPDASRAAAMAKYLELRRMGVPPEAMAVTTQPVERADGSRAWAVVLRLNDTNWLLFGDEREPLPAPRLRLASLPAAKPAPPPPKASMLLDVTPVLTSGYGWRRSPFTGETEFHQGIDLAAPEGTPVRPAGWGVVTRAGPAGAYGNLVEIQHEDGLVTRYAHLSRVSVSPGEEVGPHTLLGQVGSTGRSTAPHLHFETRYGERTMDPREVVGDIVKVAINASTPSANTR